MKKTNQILFALAFAILGSSSVAMAGTSVNVCGSYFYKSKKTILPITIIAVDSKGSPAIGAKVYIEGANQEPLITDETGSVTFYVDQNDPTKYVAIVAEDGTTVNQVVYVGESNSVTIPQ